MEEELRSELNRLWTDLQATQMFIARLSARFLDAATIEQWHESAVAAAESNATTEQFAANMARALDRLYTHLRDAEAAYRPPGQ